ACQGGSMVMPSAVPLQIIHAQPVHQHQHPRSGMRELPGQFLWGQGKGATADPQARLDRQSVASLREVIPHHAVQPGEKSLALAV
ncbi:hypothetical protein V6O07_07075, partial [Arthrospira platensis SPKY2]